MKYLSLLLLFLIPKLMAQMPLDSEFTYQGELKIAGVAVTGAYDFTFKLYDASSSGTQVGSDVFVDNVQVDNGLFTTAIDFTSSSFVGDKLWLEISVRDGNATGGFQQLLPRQAITAAPYATHSQFVGADAVTFVEILDGSITAADLGNNSVAKAEISANAVGSSEIISNQVQQRVTGSCATGQFITKVNEDGTVTCVDDNTGLSSVTTADIVDGAVTSAKIATGAVGSNAINSTQVQRRVAGNCAVGQFITAVNADGTVSCANDNSGLSSVTTADIIDGAVTSAKIAAGAVGSNAINSTQVQKRVTGSCIYPEYVTSISQIGAVVCALMPIADVVTTLDSAGVGVFGNYSSIAIGTDNNPVIAYYDANNMFVKVIKCNNSSCSTFNTPITVDSTSGVGIDISIAIGADGNPVMSYYDLSNQDLKVLKCTSPSCSTFNVPVIVDSAGDVGLLNSITIGTDGNPVMSYYDLSNQDLKVLKCSSPSCSSSNTVVTLDSAGNVGEYTSIAIGTDGNPVMSYFDATNGKLKVIKCSSPSCSSSNTPITLDSASNGGLYTSIVIGTDGNPVMSYYDSSNGDLKVVKCSNTSCSSSNTIVTLDSTGNVGSFTSIAIGTDGNPVMSYYDTSNQDLKVLKCSSPSCSSSNTPVTLDSAGNVGSYTSIAIGKYGNPVMSYYDTSNGDLKVYSCGNKSCSQ